MFHKKRTWCVTSAGTSEDVARLLTQTTWTLCTAIELRGYLFLNDSTSEDGAQEFAVVKVPDQAGGQHVQVESITFGWCNYDRALGYIQRALAGEFDAYDFARAVEPQLESAAEHGRCRHCA